MKKLILGVVFGFLLALTSGVNASSTVETILFPVKILLNGVEKNLEDEYTVLNYNGHAYVPVRFIAESLNSKVNYHADEQTITINSPYQNVPMKYNRSIACLNGDVVYISNFFCNSESFEKFFMNIENKQADWIRIVKYGVEGDAMVHKLEFDGNQVVYTMDNSRDGYGDKYIKQVTFQSFKSEKIIRNDIEFTDYILSGGSDPDYRSITILSIRKQN